jgi:hypothetical protein
MTKIIEYKIVRSNDVEDIDFLVENALADGWQPLGGVSVSLSESDEYRYIEYAQAMVKYESPEDEQRRAYTASPHLVLDWVNKNK